MRVLLYAAICVVVWIRSSRTVTIVRRVVMGQSHFFVCQAMGDECLMMTSQTDSFKVSSYLEPILCLIL
jgi:hypothetical protein